MIETLALLLGVLLPQDSSAENPREFGDVHWGRQLEPALAASKTSGKPVLLFFQEVPG